VGEVGSSVAREGSTESLTELLARRDLAAAALDRLEAAVARRTAEDYQRLAYCDQLTGALQREPGRERLSGEVARAHRTGDELVLAFLDVIGLKSINDSYGHATGDLALAALGRTLIAGLRSYDLVVRYGGDEFVCCLPGSTTSAAADRLREVQDLLADASPAIRFTSGVALLRSGETLDQLIGRADEAMYGARRAGG
jgi:diguanylate cyclase (GGDEF)-like protein